MSEINDPWTCRQCSGEMLKTSPEWLACHRCDTRLVPAPKVENLPLATRKNSTETMSDRLYSIEGHEGLWFPEPRRTMEAKGSVLNQRPRANCIVAKIRHDNGSVYPKEFKEVHKDLQGLPFQEGPA